MFVWGSAVPSSTQFKEVPARALYLAAYDCPPPRIDRLDLLAEKSVVVGGVVVDYCVLGASAGYSIRVGRSAFGCLIHSCARGLDVGARPLWVSTDVHSRNKFGQILRGSGWRVQRTIKFPSGMLAEVCLWCEPWVDRAYVQHKTRDRLGLVFDFGSMRVVEESEKGGRMCRVHPKTRITIAGRQDRQIVVHDSHDYPSDGLVVHHEAVFSGF